MVQSSGQESFLSLGKVLTDLSVLLIELRVSGALGYTSLVSNEIISASAPLCCHKTVKRLLIPDRSFHLTHVWRAGAEREGVETNNRVHPPKVKGELQSKTGRRSYVCDTVLSSNWLCSQSWKSWRSDWRGFSFLLCFTPRKRWAVWKEHRFKLLYSDNHIWISVIVFSCRVRPCGSFGPSARPSRFVTNWVCSTRSRTLTDRRIAMATRTATTPLRQVHKNTHNTHCRTDKDSAGTGNRTTTDWATGFCVV